MLGLTDTELDDFFKGTPKLMNSNLTLNAEHLDLMPYATEYEIDMYELDFGMLLILLLKCLIKSYKIVF